ncbi:MAG: hypothetical protein OXU22_06755, partial [Gammaproteobacteria bacterium]|nr:hypothetical protein [Gammaproteobacteria bacterium]
ELEVTWRIAPVALASTTGISAGDLAGNSGSLRIPADSQTARILIPTVDDRLNEGPESFAVTVSATAASGAPVTVSSPTRNFTLRDNDPVTATFAATSFTAKTAENVDLTVQLDRLSDADTVVDFSVTGAARAVGGASSVTIPAGRSRGAFQVRATIGAGAAMQTATVTLTRARVGGRSAAVGGPAATIAVTFTSPSHRFSVATNAGDTTVSEGQTAVFTVRAVGPATTDTLSVDWTLTRAGTEINDFSGATLDRGTLRFAPGDARAKTVSIHVFDDFTNEPSENFGVMLSNPTGAAAVIDPGHSAASATIAPSDPVTYSFTQSGVTVNENGPNATMTVRLSAAVEDSSVTIAISRTAAEFGAVADHLSLSANQFVFAPGETSKSVTISARADNIQEAAARVRVYLPYRATVSGDNPPVTLAGTNPFVITITDGDPTPAITVGFTGTRTGSISEGGASTTRRLSIIGSPALPTGCCEVRVNYKISGTGITASDLIITAGGRELPLNGQVVIPAGSTYLDITFAARRDADFPRRNSRGQITLVGFYDTAVQAEAAETATIILADTGAVKADTNAKEASVTIAVSHERTRDVNRLALVLADGIHSTSSSFRETANVDTVLTRTFMVIQTRPGDDDGRVRCDVFHLHYRAINYTWRITGVGANPTEPEDFVAVSGAERYPGQTCVNGQKVVNPHRFNIGIRNDGAREGAETFVVRVMSSEAGTFGPYRTNEFRGTILPPASGGEGIINYNAHLAVAGGAGTTVLTEGGRYQVNISVVNRAVEHAGLGFSYAFAGTGASPVAASELPAGGSYTLPSGSLDGAFTFVMPDDGAVESVEDLRLRLTAADGRFPAVNGAVLDFNLTLRDSDAAYLSMPSAVSAVEGGMVTVPVGIAPSVPGVVTVHYRLSPAAGPGLAPLGFVDESATPGRVTIAAGAASA